MPVKIGLKHIDLWNESLEKQVQKYEEETVEPGQIVFYGPSNFTRWSAKWGHRPLREVLVGKSGKACCVNRGFGSSCPEHQLYYYDRMVRPLAPSVLVYNCTNGNGGLFGNAENRVHNDGEHETRNDDELCRCQMFGFHEWSSC